MIKNERGSTLLVVMLMMLVFTILGLSIISTTIGGAKRTEIREEQITDDLDAIRSLGETIAYIKKTIEDDFNKGNPDMSVGDYQRDIIENQLEDNPYGYHIEDISNHSDYKIEGGKDYTRVLQVTNGKYKQIVYITGMPSFLKYAVGSRGQLTLNGSTYIEKGNIYARNGLTLSNQAKYIFGGEYFVQDTTFPSMANPDDSYLFIENENIEWCDYRDGSCYSPNTPESKFETIGFFNPLNLGELKHGFDPNPPVYAKEDTEFVDVNILKTFREKLLSSGFVGSDDEDIKSIIKSGGSHYVREINSFDDLDNDSNIKSYLYIPSDDQNDEEEFYIDTNKLLLDPSQWLVIDGDITIENIGNEQMEVAANILVSGDLTIRGNIAFNSTIYVSGSTKINNANITGLNNGELILMTQDELKIARINKFDSTVNSIKAYLYTNSDADVYAVGSFLHIEGGLFAYGDLEVNVFRGEVGENFSSFTRENAPTSSRLKIENSKKLFIGKEETFPKIDTLEVITELMSKK